jgi:uncharacterized repeat protein (TIGR03803 family)
MGYNQGYEMFEISNLGEISMSKSRPSGRVLATILCSALAIALLMAVPMQGQTPTTIYTFAGGNGNPANPENNSVAQGRDGNFYFTTCVPLSIESVMFNITPSNTLNTVYTPSNCSYGLTLGTDGNLYSTTGNNDGAGGLYGSVYKVTPTGTETLLHTFTNGTDGSYPYWPPIEGTNGIFYGTTQAQIANSTAYSVTSSGTFTTIHTFTGSDGQNVNGLVQGSDGNFYGSTQSGGTSGDGVIFKMTPTGTVTVLHNFAGTDGAVGRWDLIQAKDGNFYGVTLNGGTNGAGVLFKITSTGTYTVLYNFPSTGNQYSGNFPYSGVIQATNGLLYGVTGNQGGPFAFGSIYSFNTTTSTFTTLYSFTGGTDGGQPFGPLLQHTDGLLYGTTYVGGNGSCSTVEYDGELVGTSGCGTVFTENIGAKPFINLSSTSGKVASQVGIYGQGFSSSSVVKFNGVQATKITLTGTTYITATVPTGATSGYVTVTTGSTTLTSTAKYTVHNSWSQGAVMPTAMVGPAAGFISGKIYVVGGGNGTASLGNNQIYNPTTNTWATGTAMPTPVEGAASAVVNGLLYVLGGYTGPSVADATNLVQIYNPKTNTWSTGTAMPTARGSDAAAVDGTTIYVIGGNNSTLRLDNVEAYDTATNSWTEEAPLLVGKSEPTAGLLGTTVVSSGGVSTSGTTGDTEEYKVSTNTWSGLTADPTARNLSCFGVLSGQLYVAGGANSSASPVNLTESFNVTSDKWTTLLSMPDATIGAGSAVANGQLYCFGGGNSVTSGGTTYNYVQIYQP